MKKLLWALAVLLLACTGELRAQLASFNFSATTASNEPTGWTNVVGDPSSASTPLSAATNGITISSVSSVNWAPRNGTSAANGVGAGGGYFPQSVLSNAWLMDNGANHNLALYNAAMPQLQLSGLNKDSTYTLRMSGSNVYFSLGTTRFTVIGSTVYGSQDLQTYQNTTMGVTFLHVSPDASGVIKIFVNATTNTDVAFIGGLQVFPGSANVGVPAVAITSPGNGSILPEGGNFTINATASETAATITKVEFYVDTVKIGQSTAAPYSITWTNPDPGKYQLTAIATDNTGTINSATVNVAIASLNYFWSTTGNIATGGDTSFVGTVDTNRLAFRTNNIERMSILGNGTIGIGTKNTYGYLLAVNGTAIFGKARVKTVGTWPDYVFKKDYVLPDLQELERYISLHKHLPGITSEDEVNRDGIDIGENQAAVLKKVEELTLYLIEENKQLKGQNKQITEQNAKLQDQQRQIDELKKLITIQPKP